MSFLDLSTLSVTENCSLKGKWGNVPKRKRSSLCPFFLTFPQYGHLTANFYLLNHKMLRDPSKPSMAQEFGEEGTFN